MPPLSSVIRIVVALILTFYVIAPWYAEQSLEFFRTHSLASVDLFMVVFTLLAVLAVALLVSGMGSERPWSRWQGLIVLVALGAWTLGCLYTFTYRVELVGGARPIPGTVFAISGLWLPLMGWSTFWPMSWSTRIVLVAILFLIQPLFPIGYKVIDLTEDGQPIVLRRGREDLAPQANAPSPPPGAGPDARHDIQTELLPSGKGWELIKHNATEAAMDTSLGPEQLRVNIGRLAGNKPWEIQLSRAGLAARKGKEFAVMLRAKADAPRKIGVAITQNAAPWKNLGLYETLDIGPDWKGFRFVFIPTTDEPNARLVIDLGENASGVNIESPRVSSPVKGAGLQPPAPAAPDRKDGQKPVQPTPGTPTKPVRPGTEAPAKPVQPSPATGGFTFDPADWNFVAEGDSKAKWAVLAENANQFLRVTVEAAPAGSAWRIRSERQDRSLENGKTYTLRFRARSSKPRTIGVGVSLPVAPWTNMGLYKNVDIKGEWTSVDLTFTANAAGPSRIHFDLAGAAAAIDISDVRLIEGAGK